MALGTDNITTHDDYDTQKRNKGKENRAKKNQGLCIFIQKSYKIDCITNSVQKSMYMHLDSITISRRKCKIKSSWPH